MAASGPRSCLWLHRSSRIPRSRSSGPLNLHCRVFSSSPCICAARRGPGQTGPRDLPVRRTGRPFNNTDYNPRIPGRDLPRGWQGDGGRSAAAAGGRGGNNRQPSRREYDDDEDEEDDDDDEEDYEQELGPRTMDELDEDLDLPPDQRLQFVADMGEGLIDEDGTEVNQRPRNEEEALESEENDDNEDSNERFTADMEVSMSKEKRSDGLFDGLEDEMPETGPEPDFQPDDIMSNAHGELEQHRELREFYRLIAWDMPLLWGELSGVNPCEELKLMATDHQKPFEPPTAATPVRFRYTTYLGETHPAEKKVVCTFNPHAVPDMTEQQADKLIKLLGPRYDSVKKEAKLSCELHPTMAQNKRYIGDLLEKLVDEAKNGEDKFEDVPIDLRHMRKRLQKEGKRQITFPEEWKMTEERRAQLQVQWALSEKRQQEALEQGTLVQGAGVRHQIPVPGQQAETVMAMQRERPTQRARTTLR